MSEDLSNNPFVALFGSEIGAKQYRSTHMGSGTIISVNHEPNHCAKTETDINDSLKSIIQISRFIEEVFLITIDEEPRHGKPPRCVFLNDLKDSLVGQDWLDESSIEPAIMERIMMKDPSAHTIAASPSQKSRLLNDEVDEKDVIRYLALSFCRLKSAKKPEHENWYESVYKTCQRVAVQSGRLALQTPSLFDRCDPGGQFVNLLLSNDLIWGSELLVEFFELVALEISSDSDDSTVLEAFRPILDKIFKTLTESSLGDASVMMYVELVSFFVRIPCLALALLEYNRVSDPNALGSAYQNTLFGAMLSFCCLPKDERSQFPYFSQPSHMTLTQVESEENIIFTTLEVLNEKIYNLMLKMLKMGGTVREGLLSWLGNCLHANRGRAKLSARHMQPLMFKSLYASDGFFLNLSFIFLRLSSPFTDPSSPKPLKIQPSYCAAAKGNASDRKVHMTGLDEATLIPDSESESRGGAPPLEETYGFTTECFFMTHYCFKLGFCVLQEHLLRLNQDLTQIQRLHQDIAGQDSGVSAAAQQIKQEMEKLTSVFLCHKAALTQPSLLRLAMNFHAATAKFLNRLAAEYDVSSLTLLPEFLAENVQELLLFIHRFKDPLFEEKNELLEHFLDFILSFMASHEFMNNPHLRAGMAESLGALLPNQNFQQSSFQNSHFYRDQLFRTHPHISRLSEVVISAFVGIEVTGQAHFEDKFKYRQPMYQALEFMWGTEMHRKAIVKLAIYAEKHIEDTEAPLFLRFINLLINDAIYLLDEALSFMSQIKEKQQARDEGAWNQLPAHQRQEMESGYRHLSMLARFHNIMARRTIESLEMITQHVKTIFVNSVMVDRVAAMLNYFLLNLVGPKKKNLVVKNFEEFQFVPKILVSNICKIYINLGDYDKFCEAVSQDGRSYSPELFEQAEKVLCKIQDPPERISCLNAIGVKIEAMASRQAADEELFSDIPEEYVDPIMGTLMTDPVLLPTSGKIVDRHTIARHILSDQTDPFNRMPMTMNMVKPDTKLKQEITAWMSEIRRQHSK